MEIIEAQKAIKKVSELDESDVEAKMFSNLRSKNAEAISFIRNPLTS